MLLTDLFDYFSELCLLPSARMVKRVWWFSFRVDKSAKPGVR